MKSLSWWWWCWDDDGDDKWSMFAALSAAAWTSRGEREAGRGRRWANWGKLRKAELPLMLSEATSCALAAISGVGNVPNHIRDFLRGSLISDTHFPQFRILTPLYTTVSDSHSLCRFTFFHSAFWPLGPGLAGDFEFVSHFCLSDLILILAPGGTWNWTKLIAYLLAPTCDLWIYEWYNPIQSNSIQYNRHLLFSTTSYIRKKK